MWEQHLGPAIKAPEWVEDGCLGLEAGNDLTPEANAVRCVYGNPEGSKVLAVLGDSTAISYVPGIRAAVDDTWRIEVYTMSQCPAASVGVWIGKYEAFPECDEFRTWALDRIVASGVDRVVLASTPWSMTRLASRAQGPDAMQEWEEGQEQTFQALRGLNVVSLDAPPLVMSLAECAIAGSIPSDCVGTISQLEVDANSESRIAAVGLTGVTLPSTFGWFCSAENRCPSFIGDTPTYADKTHLTAVASRNLAPLLRDVLQLVAEPAQ